jgi:hypothetical protein
LAASTAASQQGQAGDLVRIRWTDNHGETGSLEAMVD